MSGDDQPAMIFPAVIPEDDQSTMAFPPMTPELREMAKKLMLKCSKMGHEPPPLQDPPFNSFMDEDEEEGEMVPRKPFSLFSSLLSSLNLPPPDLSFSRSADLNSTSSNMTAMEADWNVTEELWNVTTLPDMIDNVKNSTATPQCFMHAFISPVAWFAVMHGGLRQRPEVLAKLLWASRPLVENMPPYDIPLPPRLDRDRLIEIMRMYRDVFGSLSEDQRSQIRDWVKRIVLENNFNCTSKGPMRPLKIKPAAEMIEFRPGQSPPKPFSPKLSMKPDIVTLRPCPPKQRWLTMRVLRIMGRFLSRLPPQEVRDISKEELCEFIRSPEFPASFRQVGRIRAALGRTLLGRIRRECSFTTQDLLEHTTSMGSLACFYDGKVSSLNESLTKQLLAQLDDCQNSASTKLKQRLVRKLFSSSFSSSSSSSSSSSALLESLGSGVSVLSPSKLMRFSARDLSKTLPSLRRARWTAAQAATLAKALIDKTQNISGDYLLSLGTVARGVASSMLKNVRGRDLLKGEGQEKLEAVSRKMSALQRKALLQGMRGDVDVSELVLKVPGPLLSSLSLSTLRQARLTSVEQLEGRNWTRAQSAFLLKKILGKKLKPQHLRKLGRAVQGVTCEMIDSLSSNEIMESVATLSNSSTWLAKAQTCCAARKLFASLEQERSDYFRNITSDELKNIPTVMLIYLPPGKIRSLPASVCSDFLDKMKMADLSSLPHSSPSRTALALRALDCLGKNMSELSTEEVKCLGPLLCELRPSRLRALWPEVLNDTLLEMASSCSYIPRPHREELFLLVKDTFGDPSSWSEEDMELLKPFLLLDNSTLRTLPDKPGLRSALSDLMDRLSDQSSAAVPEEFRSVPDLSTLRWKLFVLASREQSQQDNNSRRRRREAVVGEATVELIEQLGDDNVFWSPSQLADMSCATFNESASRLGEICGYTTEQLTALKQKTIQCWGAVSELSESQVVELGCVSQGFSAAELLLLNITSLDTLQLLSSCMWTQTQMAAMWQGFAKRTGTSAAQLSDLEVVGLGKFVCGLEKDEVEKLDNDCFREAAESVGSAPCQMAQLECFKKKAAATFGGPQDWSEGEVMALGNIMAGLDAAELQSLNSSVFSFITSSAIPLIPPKNLAALSVSQLQALGPDNAAMVTEAQKAELGEEQMKALAETMGVVYARSEPSSGGSQTGSSSGQDGSALPQAGGAPRSTMMSLVVMLQPVLMLLLSYMC
ncbi:otoancorin [Engraulis encrasicolus]|uniref:otoancorin n=1 Tax=Engraulis encrasicolus TaxID=184585 RepID=UPI002FD31351